MSQANRDMPIVGELALILCPGHKYNGRIARVSSIRVINGIKQYCMYMPEHMAWASAQIIRMPGFSEMEARFSNE